MNLEIIWIILPFKNKSKDAKINSEEDKSEKVIS